MATQSPGIAEMKKCIRKSIEELNLSTPLQDPFNLVAGLKLHTLPPDPPKLWLKTSVQVSSQYRAEYNAWLLERFGVQEAMQGVIDPGKVFIMQHYSTVIMRPEDASILIHAGI